MSNSKVQSTKVFQYISNAWKLGSCLQHLFNAVESCRIYEARKLDVILIVFQIFLSAHWDVRVRTITLRRPSCCLPKATASSFRHIPRQFEFSLRYDGRKATCKGTSATGTLFAQNWLDLSADWSANQMFSICWRFRIIKFWQLEHQNSSVGPFTMPQIQKSTMHHLLRPHPSSSAFIVLPPNSRPCKVRQALSARPWAHFLRRPQVRAEFIKSLGVPLLFVYSEKVSMYVYNLTYTCYIYICVCYILK